MALQQSEWEFVKRAIPRAGEEPIERLERWEREVLQANHIVRAQARRQGRRRSGDMALFLSANEAAYYVHYRRQTLLRKEKAGKFPARTRFGSNSVGYETRAVLAWMIEKANARSEGWLCAWLIDENVDPIARLEGLRFVTWQEAKDHINFCRKHARDLQKDRIVPKQVRVGANSVRWITYELERHSLAILAANPVDDA
jgi:predicted DNA-binding transcriptional regulator AlpA